MGSFRKYLIYNRVKNLTTPADSHMELGDEEGFAGIWVDSVNNKTYTCHFGFERYPSSLAGDFDGGGGEPIIEPRHKPYGWEEHFFRWFTKVL